MKERLSILMAEKQLSSSKLAETIGVQPSSISHILSGRNNPSYDFIFKLSAAFRDVDMRWLLTGEGDMYTGATFRPEQTTNSTFGFSSQAQIEDSVEKLAEVEVERSDRDHVQIGGELKSLHGEEKEGVWADFDFADSYGNDGNEPASEPEFAGEFFFPPTADRRDDSRESEIRREQQCADNTGDMGSGARKIDRIVIFYSDGTFSCYTDDR